jgi:hypothetical protein
MVAPDPGSIPTNPQDKPDEAILRYARELAKRLAREDHEAEVAASLASQPAIHREP